MTTTVPPSGRHLVLRRAGFEAVIASVGATVRRFTSDGIDLVLPFGEEDMRPLYSGATLVPWPNRVVDGRYTLEGDEYQLALTEPERGHALHGLGVWVDFDVISYSDSSVELRAVIQPQQGYPWRIVVDVVYELSASGLRQRVTARNLSDSPAPFGTGPHPYFVVGGRIDDAIFLLPAAEVLLVDDRLAPTRLVDVGIDSDRFDFRAPRRIGSTELDHAFTSLTRGSDGCARVTLWGSAGDRGVEMRFGPECEWVQVHTADRPDDLDGSWHRRSLAVEPMTCAPDAFNASSYQHDPSLTLIERGGTVTASWEIGPIGSPHSV